MRALAVAATLMVHNPDIARSQEGNSAVVEAMAARDSGKFAESAALLRRHLLTAPDDGDAARLLAQTLYWLKDIAAASAVYEDALRRHPEDTQVRLEYARLLMDTRQDARAAGILRGLIDHPQAGARAQSMLGTLLYWRGDLSGARKNFRQAVGRDTSLQDARRQLNEITAIAAPWVRLRSAGLHDDQPLDALEAEGEGGFFLDPVSTLSVKLRPIHFRLQDSASSQAVVGELGVSTYIPSALIHASLAGGLAYLSFAESSTEWTGRASVRLGLADHMAIIGQVERAPYMYTIASLVRSVMSRSAGLSVVMDDPRGWAGRAEVALNRFPDSNTVTTAYAWLLAPVVRTSRLEGSLGYSASRQNAAELRFVIEKPVQNVPPADPLFITDGRYDPYYTPKNIVTHSALAGFAIRPHNGTIIRLRGGYGFRAAEDAPKLVPAGAGSGPGNFVVQPARRSFNPWDAHFSIERNIASAVSLIATANRMKTAFYTATRVGAQITYRFITPAN